MENNQTASIPSFLSFCMFFTMIGVWGLFFQNAGYFTSKDKNKRDLDEILGRTIKVDVVNMVDANIQAINGHRDVFFNNPSKGQKKKYYVLPVSQQNY